MTVQPLTPERFSARPIDDLAGLSAVRSEFRRWLQDIGVDDDRTDDLLVVLSELGANAVRESAADAAPPTVAARCTISTLEVEVANDVDPGAHAEPNGDWDLDDPLRTGGRGLLVVSALVDDVDVEVDGRRIFVRCTVAVDGQDDSTAT